MLNRFRLPAAVLLAAALCPAQEYVDQVVERARKEFDVPGIAVAIVKDGKVVLAKGYGVRKLGETAPVTAQSLFRIASNTKAFTTAALAMLVDERKIRWDDPVMQHMPGFQMYDPYVTREMTIRDLLTHRSGLGLGAGDLMFFPPGDLGRDEIIKRLRFIKPATSFRSAYAYDNLLYIVAGQLIPGGHRQELGRFRAGSHLHAARHDQHVHRRRSAASRARTWRCRTTRSPASWRRCRRKIWTPARRRARSSPAWTIWRSG